MNLTEEQETKIGERLAYDLKLRKDRERSDRWQTEWGSKTSLGLYRTIKDQLANLELGASLGHI